MENAMYILSSLKTHSHSFVCPNCDGSPSTEEKVDTQTLAIQWYFSVYNFRQEYHYIVLLKCTYLISSSLFIQQMPGGPILQE